MSFPVVLALAVLAGIIAGLRSFTMPAAVCWAAHLGWLHLEGSNLSWMGLTATVYIASALAVMELVFDKTPWIGARTKPGSLIFRIATGSLSAAAFCISSGQSIVLGVIAAAVGALIGTFGGYQARHRIVTDLKAPDILVALVEDALAVGGAFWVVSRF
jgi:uncharacterized membrane protein